MTIKSGYLASRTGRQFVIPFGFHIRLESRYFRNVDIYKKKNAAGQMCEGYIKSTVLPLLILVMNKCTDIIATNIQYFFFNRNKCVISTPHCLEWDMIEINNFMSFSYIIPYKFCVSVSALPFQMGKAFCPIITCLCVS